MEKSRAGLVGNILFAVFGCLCEYIRASNKALTNQKSRCQVCTAVMYALVTKAPLNEDESQYTPSVPRKLLCTRLATRVYEKY